ncbi:MAG: hypothetical protein IJ169_01660 [Paludibacteraceae bacterium]|nr:hypothetical protein [Paludibacteraceae bacterium]
MKKTLNLLLCGALMLAFAACNTNPGNPETPATNAVTFTDAYAGYYGTESGVSEYYFELATKGLEQNEDGAYTTAGVVAAIDILCEGNAIAAGTYTYGTKLGAGTYNPEYSKIVVVGEDLKPATVDLKNDVNILKNGDTYTITVTYTYNDAEYTGTYTGAIEVVDMTDPYLYEPEEKANLNFTFDSGEYMWDEEYAELDVEIASEKTNDWMVLAFIVEALDDETVVPVGSYTIEDSEDYNIVLPSAGYDASWDYDFPSYCGKVDASGMYANYYYLISGNVTVAAGETEGVTITVDAISYRGSVIKATYTGVLEESKTTAAPARAPQKKAAAVRPVKHNSFTPMLRARR